MALSEISTPVVTVEAADGRATPEPRLRRMSFGLLMVYVAILAVNSGGNGILLPNIVAGIDEAGKVGNLAFVTTLAFVATVFAQPVAGALSDATRDALRPPDAVDGRRRPAERAASSSACRSPSRCSRWRWCGWSSRSASTPCRPRRRRWCPTAIPRPVAVASRR